jgi:biopolymer transport protein ExbD
MRVRLRTAKRARIEIIPMIDVIFFLLVFFMVSSLAMTKINSLPVSLPKTAASAESLKQNVILTVRKTGELFLNKAPTTLERLGPDLAFLMHDHPQDVVVVNADEGAAYGLIIHAMDMARQIGVRRFALASEAQGAKK